MPGYSAPDDTVVPGTRVTRALLQIVHDAIADGRLVSDGDGNAIESLTMTAQGYASTRCRFPNDDVAPKSPLSVIAEATNRHRGLHNCEPALPVMLDLIDDERVPPHVSAPTAAAHA